MKDQFLTFLLFTLTTQGAAIYLLAILPLGWAATRAANQVIPVASLSHVLLSILFFLIEVLIVISALLVFLRFDITGHLPPLFFSDYVKVPK